MAKKRSTRPKNTRARRPYGQACVDSEVEAALEIMSRGHTMTWAAIEVKVDPATLWRRLQEPQFKKRYAEMRTVSSHAYVQQAEEALTPDMDGLLLLPQQVSLRVARAKQKLWIAGRLNPAEFADKQTITHEGNPENPVEHKVAMTAMDAYRKMLGGK